MNARADNTTADCNIEVNVCYDTKAAISTDNTPINLNTEANVSYGVAMGGTALTQDKGGEGIYHEIEDGGKGGMEVETQHII